jgi:membrane protease YdiL (CAAX protease family)
MTNRNDERSGALQPSREANAGRHIKIWHFLVLSAVYVAIVQGAGLLLRDPDSQYAEPTSVDYLVRSYVVPVGLAIVFALGVMAYLGSWQAVFTNGRPFRRWVIVIPILLFATTAVVTNYSGLGEKGIIFALLLLIATLMVGFGEELMFRGIGVDAFRRNGFSEFKVGLWTTLIFGIAHGTNIVTAGPQALVQIVLTSATGFVFYLILRSTGALVVSMAAHGLWDFAVLSTQVNPDDPSALVNVAGVSLAVILLIALVFRRRLAPKPGAAAGRTEPAAVR